MAPTPCPIHIAARESVRIDSPEPLLTKVGPRDQTAECASCAFCRQALVVRGQFHAVGGKPAEGWERLKGLLPPVE